LARVWVECCQQQFADVTRAREQCRAYHLLAANRFPEAKVTGRDQRMSGLNDRFLEALSEPEGAPIQAGVVELRERVYIASDRLRGIGTDDFKAGLRSPSRATQKVPAAAPWHTSEPTLRRQRALDDLKPAVVRAP
jgi:hypothetical protein